MDKLKPCPFCGGDGDIAEGQTFGFDRQFQPCCRYCGLTLDIYDTLEQAVSAWNTRPERWIPVGERLPEVDKCGDVNVLVCMDDGFIASATYDQNNGWELWFDAGDVTHWMSWPEPPGRSDENA